ncbi:MAG: hypothetical protein AAF515_09055 [Pseudomonadota bacterium]
MSTAGRLLDNKAAVAGGFVLAMGFLGLRIYDQLSEPDLAQADVPPPLGLEGDAVPPGGATPAPGSLPDPGWSVGATSTAVRRYEWPHELPRDPFAPGQALAAQPIDNDLAIGVGVSVARKEVTPDAIFVSNDARWVVVNSGLYTVGQELDGRRIASISAAGVVFDE